MLKDRELLKVIINRIKQLLLPGLIFAVTFAVYLACPPSSQVYSDPRWSIQLALSIVREGNFDLDEYKNTDKPDEYAVITIRGHKYSFFPIGTPILAVPPVFGYQLINPHMYELIDAVHPVAQEVIASFIVALTAGLILSISRFSNSIGNSIIVAFIFAFCTSAWSTASRALWQHGPSMLMLAFTLYLILSSRNKPELIQYASIPLAYSFVVRPTNAISVVLLTLYVLLFQRKFFFRFLLWSLVIAIPFFWINYSIFSTFLSPYTFPSSHSTNIGLQRFLTPSLPQFLGVLVSPSRGLFIYTPVILFSLAGMVIKLRKFRWSSPEKMLDFILVMIIVFHYLLVSSFWHWWGGYSIGPRLMVDVLPFLVYFLNPVVSYLTNPFKRSVPIRAVFIASILMSFLIQYHGATSEAMYAWNNVPTSVDLDQARLWDWSDPPFLRGISCFERPALK
jgi:hypothetical protein